MWDKDDIEGSVMRLILIVMFICIVACAGYAIYQIVTGHVQEISTTNHEWKHSIVNPANPVSPLNPANPLNPIRHPVP